MRREVAWRPARSTNYDEVAAEIRAAGGEAFTAELDLGSHESIKKAFAKIAKEFGRVEILVNNAGIDPRRPGPAHEARRLGLVLQTNLSGAFFCIQQVLPGMMRERWGRIVNIASVVGEAGNAGQANYVASKAGLIGLTKSLAQEMGSRDVTVNAVAPGFIETDMTAGLPDEMKQKMLDGSSAGAHGQARRRRRRREVPGQRGSQLHHRPRARRQRRHVHAVGEAGRNAGCSQDWPPH